jgi:hypothetical protein
MANETFYNRTKKDLAEAVYDWSTVADARIRLLLLDVVPAGVFDPDVDDVAELLAVATASECSGTGYVRKDVPAAGRSVTLDDGFDRIQLEAADIVWSGADFTDVVGWLMYYDSTGTDADATNWPIAYGGSAAEPNGAALTLSFPNGVARHA